MKHVLDLQVFDGDKLVAHGRFEQNKIVMGRILSADFRISDSRVSRIHALLERLDDGSIRITDLASSHGTTVNNERVIERVIGPADDIRIAGLKLQMTFQAIEDAPEAPTSAPRTAKAPEGARSAPPSPVASPAARASVPPSAAAPAVKTNRDPTVVRSLKDSAHSRGVLDSTTKPHEELEVTVYWGETILNVDHCRDRRKTIRIGESVGNDYIVASSVLPSQFDFIRVNGSEAEIQMHPSMRGSARVGGKIVRFEQDAGVASSPSSIRLAGDDIAKIQVGSVHFFLMFVGKPPEIPRDVIFDQGRLYWFLQISFSIVALLFLWLGTFYKPPIEGIVKEFPEQIRRVIVQTYRKQNRPAVVGDKAKTGVSVENAQQIGDKAQQAGGDEGAGARERGEEGKRGTKDSQQERGVEQRPVIAHAAPPQPGKQAPAPAPKIGKSVKLGQAPKLTENAKPKPMAMHSPKPTNTPAETIMSALRGSGISNGTSQGGGKFSGQVAVDEAFTGVGGTHGNGRGSGGSGLQGSGTGGGGTAVGVGGLGTSGFGAGAKGNGTGSIPGEGGGVSIGTETQSVYVLGSLSKEEIERVVRAHASEIRYCYDREIARNPSLSGKVTMKWTIVGAGRVESVSTKDNSTGSKSLSDCIGGYLKDWKFPTPAEGSSSDVEYPWIFKPKGS
ncbi:MAG: AgmX/PglI C-terminal domain-containing protein [Bdellovibrionota bacterium]